MTTNIPITQSWERAGSPALWAEVERLRAVNAQLLAALVKARTEIEAHWTDEELSQEHCGMEVALDQVRAAIKEGDA